MARRRSQRTPIGTGLCLLVLITAASARGQVLTTIEFSFSNPGARSMGFGGAFVALADDATAAFANPAGLVQLSRPEVSIEGRSWRYSSPYTTGGRAFGAPTGRGIDTVAHPLRVDSEAELSGLSFLSVVYPKKRWSFAFYHHQLQNFELREEIQGIFQPGPVAGAWRGPIERGFFDFDLTTNALAVGYRVGNRASLGIGISRFESSSHLNGSDYLPDADSLEAYFAPASFLPARLIETVTGEMGGTDWGLALGFLYGLTPSWKLGGVYRQGPELEVALEGIAGPAHPDVATGQTTAKATSPWAFPDVFGLGLSYRSANGRWTGSFEWTRVEYSTILESLDVRLHGGDDVLEDADELHLGGEYAFFRGRSVLAVRLGAWLDPAHQPSNDSFPFARAELPGGEDELHFAAGCGVARNQLQFDLGIDLSELRDTVSLSAIYSF